MAPSTFQRIAHPTTLAQDSEYAFYHALRLAVAARSRLDVLHVVKDVLTVPWDEFPSASQTLTQWGFRPEILQSGGNGGKVRAITAYGREPVKPLLEYIDEHLPDLMVVATHRRHGIDRWLHKEIAQKLARQRAIATLFVPFGNEGFVSPSRGEVELHRVLIPVDWIPGPQAAVDAAAELARVLECAEIELTLLNVGDRADDFPAVVTPEREGWTWQRQTRSGMPVDEILAEAEEQDADLIVMVTAGHEGFLDALRGSTTERVLQQTQCPLLAVPTRDPAL